MAFLNWSDPEELVGLLAEYVADEANEAEGDAARRRFLSDLSRRLSEFDRNFDSGSVEEAISRLSVIRESINSEFADDSVVTHVDACIEELERVKEQGPA